MDYNGYCVKCKSKKDITSGIESTTKNNMRMAKGKCPDCGTTVCKILGKA